MSNRKDDADRAHSEVQDVDQKIEANTATNHAALYLTGALAILIFGVPLLVLAGAATLAGASITILALGLVIAALDTDPSGGVNALSPPAK